MKHPLFYISLRKHPNINVLLVACLFLLFLPQCKEKEDKEAPQVSFKVKGILVSDCNGNPAASRTVILYKDFVPAAHRWTNAGPEMVLGKTITDAEGRFSFDANYYEGTYPLSIRYEYGQEVFVLSTRNVAITNDETFDWETASSSDFNIAVRVKTLQDYGIDSSSFMRILPLIDWSRDADTVYFSNKQNEMDSVLSFKGWVQSYNSEQMEYHGIWEIDLYAGKGRFHQKTELKSNCDGLPLSLDLNLSQRPF